MYIKILIFTISFLLSGNAFACRCFNEDIHVLFEKADIVVFSTLRDNFIDNKQKISMNRVFKGERPVTGLYLSQQKTICGYPQLPLETDRSLLLFISKFGDEYKLTSSCYNYAFNKQGLFDLRIGTPFEHANVHLNMLKPFLQTKGKIPKIKLLFSSNVEGTETTLSIENLEDEDIEIFHPSNRQALTFFVIDERGNPLVSQGLAKVHSMEGTLIIPAGGTYSYVMKSKSGTLFPYLSGTAEFGYTLEQDKEYRVHAVYRPFGGLYGTVVSKEKTVRIFEWQ